MGTAEWYEARQIRARETKRPRPENIFAGGSSFDMAKACSTNILRLSVWPRGSSAAPYSFALEPEVPGQDEDEADETAADEFDFVDFEDEKVPVERRKAHANFAEEFANLDEGKLAWKPTGEAKLPFNLEWVQAADSRWELFFDLPVGAMCMGLGERNSGLNLRSARHTLFNTDDFNHIESIDSMYKTIPFLIVWHQGECFGLFLDSPARHRWDLDSELNGSAHVELLSRRGWQLYCIGPGSLPNVVGAYTKLTGRSKLPPLWSLGHQQSRWSYPDQDTVIRIAHEFRSRQIPCDTIVLDIDYMDDYRVFTFSKERFPNFKDLISDLKNNHFQVVTIVDPGVKKDAKYFVFNDGKKHDVFCTRSDGKTFIGDVWAGTLSIA